MRIHSLKLKPATEEPEDEKLSVIVGRRRQIRRLAFLVSFFLAVASVQASYKTILGGVTVSYSGDAIAYFDSNDGTLTVRVLTGGGNLLVSVGPSAPVTWGEGVDIYILADDQTLKSINIKGSPYCTPYVCGDVWYVSKFSLSLGVVGNTIYYGGNYGLGMGSMYIPTSISLKNSYATAQLFGYPN
jgi:hypothetical protein